ncbi:MAG: hypothetical protein GX434_18370 [Peptococcaceae bacterium]|nr:hypothetical protein [Peptococcaceae bacterium]
MPHIAEHVVFMENVSSGEHFLTSGGSPRRVLSNISLLMKRSEAWGITGTSLYEIKLLLEIMANIRPYDSGRCVLIEQGMPRRKRVILRHVFYIGNSQMIYNNMNVLEYLMFVTGKLQRNQVELQEEIFELLIGIGLGPISLSPNNLLTKEEKAVVALLAAVYSGSIIIVFNLPEYEFDPILSDAIAKLSNLIRKMGKTLILGTKSCLLIEKASTHSAVVAGGKVIYSGTVENFRYQYDHVIVKIRDKQALKIKESLTPLLPGYQLSIKNDTLMISGSPERNDPELIYKKVLESGFIPELMEMNPKTVQNAYEELILEHDLPQ